MSTTKNKKMTIEVNTIINTFETGYQDKIYKTWNVSGDTLDECFKNAYPTERSYRYCTGHSIRFVDPAIHVKYLEWKQYGMTMEDFYSSVTVD